MCVLGAFGNTADVSVNTQGNRLNGRDVMSACWPYHIWLMLQTLRNILPALHLTRVTTAFAAVANVWFVVLWTHACPQEGRTENFVQLPLWMLLGGAAVNALGLFGFTTALNDVLDRRRDQVLHPDRPLPSGRLSLEVAVSLVVLTLVTAVLGATVLGTLAVLVTLLVAGASLFFNAAGKYVPAVGLVVLGLIHAGQMVTPNLHLKFGFPVWVVMTHALLIAAASHVLGMKTPGISKRATLCAVLGWVFWSLVMIAFAWFRSGGDLIEGMFPSWVRPGVYLFPPVLGAMMVLWIAWRRRVLGRGPALADSIIRTGALWHALYCSAILIAQGHTKGGVLLASVAGAGLLGMTVVREAVLLFEQPLAYRK